MITGLAAVYTIPARIELVRAGPFAQGAYAVREGMAFIGRGCRLVQRLAGELLAASRAVSVFVCNGDHLVLYGTGLVGDVVHYIFLDLVGIGMGAATFRQCGNRRRQAEQQRHQQTAESAKLHSDH